MWTHFSFFFNVYALYASSCCQVDFADILFILKCVERFLIYMYIFYFFYFFDVVHTCGFYCRGCVSELWRIIEKSDIIYVYIFL